MSEGNVDCPAEKREQKHDLFQRHGDPPFPPLGIRGGRDLQEQIAFVRGPGTGKGYPPAFVGAAPDDGVSAADTAIINWRKPQLVFRVLPPDAEGRVIFFHA